MPDRWTDDRIDDFARQVWTAIDDLPNRMTRAESRDQTTTDAIKRLENEVHELRDEFRASRQGMTRGERIALLGASGGFLGAVAAAAALVIGGLS